MKLELKHHFDMLSCNSVIFGGDGCYKLRCPYKICNYFDKDLARHLSGKSHRWKEEDKTLESNSRVKLYKYITAAAGSGRHKPAVCRHCNRAYDRQDMHVVSKHTVRIQEFIKIEMVEGFLISFFLFSLLWKMITG